tara:strand:+ start:429 stop:581 length:153 start_codon:yes stop_codon:yes gene_type:complete
VQVEKKWLKIAPSDQLPINKRLSKWQYHLELLAERIPSARKALSNSFEIS